MPIARLLLSARGRARLRARLRAIGFVAALAYAWVAAGLRPFTLPMDAAVGLVVLAVLALTVVRRGGVAGARAGGSSRLGRPPGGAVWIGLVVLLGGWELVAYLSSPRHAHPTLSSIADQIMGSHEGRAAMFALWLVLGWSLFVRRAPALVGASRSRR